MNVFLGERLVGVAAVERTNPLPAGRYWIDVFAPDTDTFNAWLSSNTATIKVISTQHFDANSGGPPRDWILFQVTAPTPWHGPGFPTIADASVTSSDDTAQKPPPSTPSDMVPDFFKSGPSTWTIVGVTAVLAVVGAGLVIYYVPRRRVA